jgi:hypothetical protein
MSYVIKIFSGNILRSFTIIIGHLYTTKYIHVLTNLHDVVDPLLIVL